MKQTLLVISAQVRCWFRLWRVAKHASRKRKSGLSIGTWRMRPSARRSWRNADPGQASTRMRRRTASTPAARKTRQKGRQNGARKRRASGPSRPFPQCRESIGCPTEARSPGAGGHTSFQCPAEFPFRSLSTPVWPTTERGIWPDGTDWSERDKRNWEKSEPGKQANTGRAQLRAPNVMCVMCAI